MEHSLKYIIYCIQHSSVCVLSHVQLFATSWTVAHQAPLSMEFSRQENWSGVPFPSPGDLPNPRIKPASLSSLALASSLPLTHLCFLSHRKKIELQFSSVTQSCPTLCDPMDCSPPGSSVHGISQARIQEWVAISFSRGSSQPKD